MPYSVDEFAAQIKAKFPQYASWPSDHLVSEIVAKHPEYSSWVTLDPRTEIAMRKANPPASAHGDPNARDIGVGDVLGAAGKGLAHLAGIPTSMAEVPGAAKDLALNAATMGMYGPLNAEKQIATDVSAPARAYASGQAPTAEQNAGAVPIIGRPALETARPAIAYSHGNAPTRAENLGAVESGTALAGMAAMAHPAVAGAIAKVLPSAGAAIEASGKSQYADALAAEGTVNRPLAESLGSQLAEKGKVMSNPKKQLGTAFGGAEGGEAVPVQKFKTIDQKIASAREEGITASRDPTTTPERMQKLRDKYESLQQQRNSGSGSATPNDQLAELQKKYPDATITDDGNGNFIVNKPGERSLNQQGADKLAADMPTPEVQAWWQKAAKVIVPGGIGAKVGAMIGGAPGAMIGAAVGEIPYVVNAVVKSPLWNTASAVVKTSLGKAMMAQDAAAVTTIAARVLGGVNLEDAYSHDAALHGLVSSLPPDPVMLHQALGNYTAVYENPDGSHVQVPFHVQKRTFDAIAGQ